MDLDAGHGVDEGGLIALEEAGETLLQETVGLRKQGLVGCRDSRSSAALFLNIRFTCLSCWSSVEMFGLSHRL